MNDSEGIVSVESRFEVPETLDHLAETVTGLGLYVFARIDQAAGGTRGSMTLRPTQL